MTIVGVRIHSRPLFLILSCTFRFEVAVRLGFRLVEIDCHNFERVCGLETVFGKLIERTVRATASEIVSLAT